jgi:heptosyltransferase-2
VLAPGAGLPEKRWPLERFVALTRHLLEDPRVRIAVVGSPADREAGETLAAQSGPSGRVATFCGGSIRRTFALLAGGDGALSNSSMVLHAAAAFDKPTLVLLGPAFGSVSEHDAQWAHPGSLTLGPEPGTRPSIAPVDEATAAARRLFLEPGA